MFLNIKACNLQLIDNYRVHDCNATTYLFVYIIHFYKFVIELPPTEAELKWIC